MISANIIQIVLSIILIIEVIFLEKKKNFYRNDERGRFINLSATEISFFSITIPFLLLLALDLFNLISKEWFGPAVTFLVVFVYSTCTIAYLYFERKY